MMGALKGSAEALGQFGQAVLIFLTALLPVAAVLAIISIPIYLIVRSRIRWRKHVPHAPALANPETKEPDNQDQQ
jgi:hypothetical protein